jgi:hypothetical protein
MGSSLLLHPNAPGFSSMAQTKFLTNFTKEGEPMKVMVVWKAAPGKYKAAVEEFLRKGGPVPSGAKTVGRWHTPGSSLGWHLIESDDLTVVAQHVAEWADLIECQVHPVIEDAEAATAAKRAFGK